MLRLAAALARFDSDDILVTHGVIVRSVKQVKQALLPTGAQPTRLQRRANEAHAGEDACAPAYDHPLTRMVLTPLESNLMVAHH